MVSWIYRWWVAAALGLGVLLVCLLPIPILQWQWKAFTVLIYLHTPIYMLHQVEEHLGDRFRRFVNDEIYGGLDALTPVAVLWTNIPCVWGVTGVALYFAVVAGAGWGLIATYLVAVNGAVHVVGAVVKRRYNPGLVTAVLLFLPLSGITFWKSANKASWVQHATGLLVAVIIHAVLVIHTRQRANRLRAAGAVT